MKKLLKQVPAALAAVTSAATCYALNDPALAAPGEALSHQKISNIEGNFAGPLDHGDEFGTSVSSLPDLDGDGVDDLVVGAVLDDDGGVNRGAVWILFLNPDGTVRAHQKISDTEGGFTAVFADGEHFGMSVSSLGDLDGDGIDDLAVGTRLDNDGFGPGAVWILFLNPDGTVKAHQKISDSEGGFTGTLEFDDAFGHAMAGLGDLDGDGVVDLAVGAGRDDDGGNARGALWILFLNTDGTVKAHQKISDSEGGFTGLLANGHGFGNDVSALGDLDGDGIGDLAVATPGDGHGAVWILFLNPDGTVKAHQKIGSEQGGFIHLFSGDSFGFSVSTLHDLDGDHNVDLAVGGPVADENCDATGCCLVFDCDGAQGNVWILLLNTDGTIKAHVKIGESEGGFTGNLDEREFFGTSVGSLGDLDGDGVVDLAVGARWDGFGETEVTGAVWILFLDGVVPPIALDVSPSALTWNTQLNAAGYDVIRGDVGVLRSSGGDFASATAECVVAMHEATSFPYTANPVGGEGHWFLVRALTATGNGSYDSEGSGQVGLRDTEIAASGFDCP